ncbi:restriction endonuclease subunit S [Dorea formicigenerans]|uniref:restriction endonuclease subunit S n=1 Tax=Dorea formicigenerans TaxID=39486 RepID=UPI0032BF9E8C
MEKPKIRFKGYQEDWEQRKLNEIADKVSEKNKNNEFSEPFTNSAEQGIISQKDYFDREIVNNENLNGYYIVRNDDFIYNPRISVTAPVGPINRNRLGRNGVMSPLYTVFRTHDIDNLYLEFYFKTTKWHRFMKLNGDSGARFDRFTISSTQFMEMPIPYPTLEEQQKIGEYFDSLDLFITLHQRKCEEMKTLKKYMLQKMFPQNGQLVPQIRFSGFTEDWEQRKLGDIASSFEYGLNAAAKEYDGENKYIRITDIDDNTHEFLTDNLTSPDIDLTGADNYKLTERDILFARTGASVGKSYIYRNSDGLVYYAGFLIRARIKEEYDAEFVFQNTLTDRYNKYIAVTSQRSGQPGVNAQEYAEFEIEVPKKEEQTKIGTYFRNIDHLITLHQQKCDELRNIKKFMLQNMFI